MIIVPNLLQRLVAHYGVDAEALGLEMQGAKRVRTRTWLAGRNGTPRHEIQSLPTAFPPFKGVITDKVLRIEQMNLGNRAFYSSGETFSRIILPWPDLPETIIAGMIGRPLSQLIGHPGIGQAMIVTAIGEKDDGGDKKLSINFEMPLAPLRKVATEPSRLHCSQDIDLNEIISRTHDRINAPALDPEILRDSRRWAEAIGTSSLSMLGLQTAHPVKGDAVLIAMSFPYSKDTAKSVGRAGVGAWFDRNTYAWNMEPTTRSLEWLSGFLETRDVVIGPDGAIHCKRKP